MVALVLKGSVFQSAVATVSCPDIGGDVISTAERCQIAASTLGLNPSNIQSTQSTTTKPAGCYVYKASGSITAVGFNSNLESSISEQCGGDTYSICLGGGNKT